MLRETGDPLVSIIVCSRDRAASLDRTLRALGQASVPPGWKAEVLVVDNGSTDETARVAQSAALPKATVRYVYEGRPGLSRARNAGLAQAAGEIILFTDDDALPAKDWIERMVAGLEEWSCEALSGHFAIAPSLRRPWLTPMHLWWLGSSDQARPHEGVRELVGGNMGFRRSVLDLVPAFDPELGAGALGFADDSLFAWQLAQAGFRIGYAPDARAVHGPDPSRLTREHWLDAARKRGRSEAYLRYHWEHRDIRFPRVKRIVYEVKLRLRRSWRRPGPPDQEGCPLWEMSYILQIEKNRHFRVERKRPRNYPPRGLVKCGGLV